MAVVEELIRSEVDGTISFGNHKLAEKSKLDQFQHEGAIYKVKTYQTLTRLEKNELFLFESDPGTSVTHFKETGKEVAFLIEGDEDAQITVGLKEDSEYVVYVNDQNVGKMKTGLGGKLSFGVELQGEGEVKVRIVAK